MAPTFNFQHLVVAALLAAVSARAVPEEENAGQPPADQGLNASSSSDQFLYKSSEFTPGEEEYFTGSGPTDSGRFPSGTGDYPSAPGSFSSGTGDYPSGPDFPSGSGDYPSGTGQYPSGPGTGEYPSGAGQEDYPSAPVQYNFQWDVNDPPSRNFYGHQEEREDDNTKGRLVMSIISFQWNI